MDCEWQKRLMVSSELATDRRNLRMLRRPRIRRKENSARASRRPVRRASVTSRYSLCLSSDLTSSKTGDGRSASASVSGFTASLQNAFFRYIYSQSVFMRERDWSARQGATGVVCIVEETRDFDSQLLSRFCFANQFLAARKIKIPIKPISKKKKLTLSKK